MRLVVWKFSLPHTIPSIIGCLEVMDSLMGIVIVIEISRMLKRVIISIGLPVTRNLLIWWARWAMIVSGHVCHMFLSNCASI